MKDDGYIVELGSSAYTESRKYRIIYKFNIQNREGMI